MVKKKIEISPEWPAWRKEIAEACNELGLSMKEVSLSAGMSQSYLRDTIKRDRTPSAENLNLLKKALGINAEKQPLRSIPIIGRIGGGACVDLIPHEEQQKTAPASPDADENTVALEATGDSLHPFLNGGTLIYYSKSLSPDQLINNYGVIKLSDGRLYVKIIRYGKEGLFTLESINPIYPTMVDQSVDWAAKIDWIKPK